MKAIEFKEQNIVFGENQKEYQPLPAHVEKNGIATFCFELTEAEARKFMKSGRIFITRLTFNAPVQPIKASFNKQPTFPVDHKDFSSEVSRWSKTGEATMKLQFSYWAESNESIKIWLSTCTFGAPLQPLKITV